MNSQLPQDVLVVRSGRNPYMVCLALAMIVISGYGLLFSPPSASIDYSLTFLQRALFTAINAFSATAILIGIYHRVLEVGLFIERVGQFLLLIGTGTYLYGLCTVSSFERSGIITSIACALCFASVWRIRQITQDLKAINQHRENNGTK